MTAGWAGNLHVLVHRGHDGHEHPDRAANEIGQGSVASIVVLADN
jgi:hypothetical protein